MNKYYEQLNNGFNDNINNNMVNNSKKSNIININYYMNNNMKMIQMKIYMIYINH